jgi:hypothetical protein
MQRNADQTMLKTVALQVQRIKRQTTKDPVAAWENEMTVKAAEAQDFYRRSSNQKPQKIM